MRLIRLLKNDLAKESKQWVDEHIISEAQAEQICARYNADYHQAKSHSFAYNVLVGLAYLFIGLALITLLSANWEEIPRALRMACLIILTVGTHLLALKKYLANALSSATGLFLLANLFYGASIILIAQIYHLGEHMPDGVFWWALGCLPFGVLLNSTWLTLQALILSLIWFFLETGFGFYPTLFPIFIAASIYVLYRGQQSILLFLMTIFSIGCWIEFSLALLWSDHGYLDFHIEHVAISVSMFIFTYLLSIYLNIHHSVKAQDYGAVLAIWSLRFGLIVMLIMSFEDSWKELISEDWQHQANALIVIAIFTIATLYLAYITQKVITSACILVFYLCTLVIVMTTSNVLYAQHLAILYNVMLIIAGIWLIILGIQRGISHYYFLGITTILVTAFIRYIDLIGDYIGGAILFMVFAVLLLGTAKYWKHKKAGEALS